MCCCGGGIGEVELWHGELHLRLPAGAGTKLSSLPLSDIGAALKGFPIGGSIDITLEKESVQIR